jgi:hypothetical protein
MWREVPRALRVEFLVTMLLIELLALATMVVLQGPRSVAVVEADQLEDSFDR